MDSSVVKIEPIGRKKKIQKKENDKEQNEARGSSTEGENEEKEEEDLFMLSTTDFFYPLVDDPYLQGRIACANVLSDLYAMGVCDISTTLMTLSVSTQMNPKEQSVVTSELIRGYSDAAAEAETSVTGGQTVLNPWPIVGGVAMSVGTEASFIRPESAVAGDVIVLTKPLGTQVAVNVFEWLHQPQRWEMLQSRSRAQPTCDGQRTGGDCERSAAGAEDSQENASEQEKGTLEKQPENEHSKVNASEPVITEAEARAVFEAAKESMARLNKNAARLMHKYKAHAATDVTGFGILGHMQNLAGAQKAAVDLELHALPILRKMVAVDEACGGMFKLVKGYSAETSGGLLVCLPAEEAEDFMKEVRSADGQDCWLVGRVVSGSGQARIVEDVTIIDV